MARKRSRQIRTAFEQIANPIYRDALDARGAPRHRVAMIGVCKQGCLGDDSPGPRTLDGQVRAMRERADKRNQAVHDAIEPSNGVPGTEERLARFQVAAAAALGPEFVQSQGQHDLDHEAGGGFLARMGEAETGEYAMRSILILALVASALSGVTATAQNHVGGHHSGSAAAPYAGLDMRRIKALSPQQIADLQAGRGMGLALPAELNGYPGPVHVLELTEALGLTVEQRSRSQALTDAMRAETIPIGVRIVGEEAALDGLFAERTITPARLRDATRLIATSQGDLRAAHLRYHLLMAELLTPDQIARYNRLRGYGPAMAMP